MAKIYKSFEELLEKNQSIFSFLGKSGRTGIMKAVWEAREAEIEELKSQIDARGGSASRSKAYSGQLVNDLNEMTNLRNSWKDSAGKFEAKLNSTLAEFEKFKADFKNAKISFDKAEIDAEQAIQDSKEGEIFSKELKIEWDHARAENEQLLADVDHYRERSAELKASNDTILKNLEEKEKNEIKHKKYIKKLEGFTAKLETDLGITRISLEKAMSSVNSLEVERKELNNREQEFRGQIEKLRTLLDHKDIDVRKMSADVGNLAADKNRLTAFVEELKVEVSGLKEDALFYEEETKSRSGELERLTIELDAYKENQDKWEDYARQSRVYSEQSKTYAESSKKDLIKAKNDLDRLRSKHMELKEKFEILTAESIDLDSSKSKVEKDLEWALDESEKVKLESLDWEKKARELREKAEKSILYAKQMDDYAKDLERTDKVSKIEIAELRQANTKLKVELTEANKVLGRIRSSVGSVTEATQ